MFECAGPRVYSYEQVLEDFDTAELAILPRLPDTREELTAMARALGVEPSKVLYLGKDANACGCCPRTEAALRYRNMTMPPRRSGRRKQAFRGAGSAECDPAEQERASAVETANTCDLFKLLCLNLG
jgi:hypothetical protein